MKKYLVSIGMGTLAGMISFAITLLLAFFLSGEQSGKGWQVNYNLGRLSENSDFLTRTRVAAIGLGALVAEEALYYTTFRDATGNLLRGKNARYQLHFEEGSFPDVDAFWSLTLYGKDNYLIANKIDRYAISDRTNGLKYNPDGSLDIIVSHRIPAEGGSNWLPAPAGEFSLSLRAYLPSQTMLAGDWMPPDLIKLQ